MRFTVKTKLTVAFGVIILLMVASAVWAISGLGTINDRVIDFSGSLAPRMEKALEIRSDLLELARAEKNMLLSENEADAKRFAAVFDKGRDDLRGHVDKLHQIASEEGRKKLDAFNVAFDRYLGLHAKIRELTFANSNNTAQLMSRNEGRQAINAMEESLGKIIYRDKANPATALLASRVVSDLLRIVRAEKNMILARDPAEKEREDRTSKDFLAKPPLRYEEMMRGIADQDRPNAEQFWEQFQKWVPLHNQIKVMATENTNSKAFALSAGDARQAINEANAKLLEIAELNANRMADGRVAAQELYQNTRLTLILLVGISVVLAIGTAAWIAIGVSRGLAKASAMAQAVAAGDLTQTAILTGNDEITDLLAAVNDMVLKLRNIVGEVTSASQNVSAGSQELSASSEEMSQGATEQAASAEEASASMEQMASNIKQNAENASQTEKIARQSAKDAQTSGEAVSQHPIPVVMCSSLTEEGSETLMQALEAGAVDIILKPRVETRQFLLESRVRICDAVKGAARAKLGRLRRGASRSFLVEKKLTADAMIPPPKPGSKAMARTTEKVVCMGASTGGTESLREVLENLPADSPGIVIVQHMPEKFTAAFARRLDSLCAVSVKEAEDGDPVLRGHVLIAPGMAGAADARTSIPAAAYLNQSFIVSSLFFNP